MLKKLLFVTSFVVIFSLLGAITSVSGDVSGQIWTGGVYLVTSTVSVTSGSSLTILPGTVVKFAPGQTMYIRGTLTADADPESPIVFTSWYDDGHGGDTNNDGNATSPAPNQWGGVQLYYPSSGPAFDNCVFLYGAYGTGWMLNLYQCPTGFVRNSTFAYSQNYGLDIYGGSHEITGNTFTQNIHAGLRISNCETANIILNNSFTQNGNHAAYITNSTIIDYRANTLSGNFYNDFRYDNCTLGANLTWDTNYIHMVNALNVPQGISLTILPGTTFKSATGYWYVRGSLIADGTAQNPIIFTSWYDDTHGGDTNHDGNATTPAPNQWGGIQLYYASSGPAFDHCEFYYAAYSLGSMLNVYSCPSGYIRNSIFAYSQNYGVDIYGGNHEISGNTFSQNIHAGLRINNCPTANTILNNSFIQNGNHAAYITNSAIVDYRSNTLTGNFYNNFRYDSCTLETNLTWDTNYVHMVNSLNVPQGISLTILPGTTCKSLTGYWYVRGTLIANGTTQSPITFTSWYDDSHGGDTNNDGTSTSPAPNQWGGIQLYYASSGPAFDHCGFYYAAYSLGSLLNVYACPTGYIRNSTFAYSQNYGLDVYSGDHEISGNTFADNLSVGLRISNGGSACDIRNNSFLRNNSYALYMSSSQISAFSGNTLSENFHNVFRFDSCSVSGNISLVPSIIYMINNLYIPADASLTLLPGTVIKSVTGSWDVRGTLNAIGTASSRIAFTSWYDDSIGGDTNHDGSSTSPAPNQWGGVQLFYSASGPAFSYCDFAYGAYATGYLLSLYQCPAGYVRDCSFRFSQNYGIMIYNTSPQLRRNSISDNISYGIHISGNSSPSLGENLSSDPGRNSFHNNYSGQYQIYNGSTNQIHAVGNLWDWSTAPEIDSHLYDDEENTSFGAILFSPWLSDLPASPVITDFHYTPEGIVISWNPVTQTIAGNPVSISNYSIEASNDPFAGDEEWSSIGTISATSGIITGPAFSSGRMFFRVIAIQ